MSPRKQARQAAKKEAPKSALAREAANSNDAVTKTLMYGHYAPEREILRVNVQETADVGGTERQLGGRDVDIPVKDLPKAVRDQLLDVFERIAEAIGATIVEPIQSPRNEPDDEE